MYARIDPITAEPGVRDGTNVPDSGTPGARGTMTLRQLSGPAAAVVTLWDTRPDAAGYPEAPGKPSRTYHVVAISAGKAADEQPSHAAVLHFDRPQTPEQIAATDFAWQQRIRPAITDVPGLVGLFALRSDDLGEVVIHLGTSMTALETAGQTVMATELLPGEDPALLAGPDRIEFHRVTNCTVAVRSETAQNR